MDPGEAMQQIEAASGIPFSYNDNILPNLKVSGDFENTPLRQVLSQVLDQLNLSYTYRKGIIILLPSPQKPRVAAAFSISGYIEDSTSGERLIGATVYDAKSRMGVVTNEFGFFSLRVPPDSVKLVVSMLGFAIHGEVILVDRNIRGTVRLRPNLDLETVEIIADQERVQSELGGISSFRIPISDLRALPALMGETDVLAGLSLLPGVSNGGEGATGLYVRGGGPDQNLILYDGVPIYNSSHLFGFYSVFNSDGIKDIQLVKGGFPARYGGRLSSVINIRMKEGNLKEIHGTGNVGLTSGRVMLEGPLIKDKLSFMASARRTLLEPYLGLISNNATSTGGNLVGYNFYDLNGKLHWKMGKRDGIYLSGYTGGDAFSSGYQIDTNNVSDKFDFKLRWGNSAGILRWHHDWTKNLFSDFSLFTTKYQYRSVSSTQLDFLGQNFQRNELSNQSLVEDIGAKFNFDWLPSNRHFVRIGGTATQHQFNPEILQRQNLSVGEDTSAFDVSQEELRPFEANAYIEDQVLASDKISFNIGLHASFYKLDTFQYSSLQPRVSFRAGPSDSWGVYGSFSSMVQYLHLLSNSGVGLPIDLWVPATEIAQPEVAQQYSLGMDRTFSTPGLQISVEGYYKSLKNLIDYETGANFLGDTDWQERVAKEGKGLSYGIEVFLRKAKGPFRGWVGYTWSKTFRQFESINLGERYPYKYDRRHDFSTAAIYDLNDRIQVSANFVFGTGTANTIPEAVFYAPTNPAFDFWTLNDGNEVSVVIEYKDRNSFRLPAYHRLDLNLKIHKKRSWGETYWNFGLYNAYNRRNPYFLFLRADYSKDPNAPEIKARKLSLLPILPSVNWGFKF